MNELIRNEKLHIKDLTKNSSEIYGAWNTVDCFSHTHTDFYELCLVTDGMYFNQSNPDSTIKKGDILLFNIGSSHSLKKLENNSCHFTLAVSDAAFSLLCLTYFGKEFDFKGKSYTVKSLDEVKFNYLKDLIECISNDSYSTKDSNPIIYNVIYWFLYDNSVTFDSNYLSSVVDEIIKKVKDYSYIYSHISDIYSEYRLSPASIIKEFKKKTGMPPNKYLLKSKLKCAKTLLITSDKSMSEITYYIGLSSTSYFFKCFKKEYGITPLKYRKSKKNDLEGNKISTFVPNRIDFLTNSINMNNSEFISCDAIDDDICPIFKRDFSITQSVESVRIKITALGVYEAYINGKKIGINILSPGWTVYDKHLLFQTYDITNEIKENNTIEIILAKGWHKSRVGWRNEQVVKKYNYGIKAEVIITYEDHSTTSFATDSSWRVAASKLKFCEIYDGVIFDNRIVPNFDEYNVVTFKTNTLISPQENEPITCHEIFAPKKIITPKGECVLDFGQEISGSVEFCVEKCNRGDLVELEFGEVLDQDGNFYNENYRSAKPIIKYICSGNQTQETYMPTLTYFGFRYMRINSYPGEIVLKNFKAVAFYSDMEQTGFISTQHKELNKLFSNILWGQKCNFLDVPTDCPQRDERLGWTGDAQVFCKTACYNFNVFNFFEKWLCDMRLEQGEDGAIPYIIPNYDASETTKNAGAGWSDACTIIPYTLYQFYGKKSILSDMFECMKKYIEYIGNNTTTPYLYTGGKHFGDWLSPDCNPETFIGPSNIDLIASAFYAYSTYILIQSGRELNIDVKKYEVLYYNIQKKFKEKFSNSAKTQTELSLIIYFGLCDDAAPLCKKLNNLIINNNNKLNTGFIGTPYLLHALSIGGYYETAYNLLLNKEYPSWLYPISKGATTVWEHWDGIKEDGSLYDSQMNSYNHYAYGSVLDWVYSVSAGISPLEPGFKKIKIEPHPDKRLGSLKATYTCPYGNISVKWEYIKGEVQYTIKVPTTAEITINHETKIYEKGTYHF